jgi:hypothetical protein
MYIGRPSPHFYYVMLNSYVGIKVWGRGYNIIIITHSPCVPDSFPRVFIGYGEKGCVSEREMGSSGHCGGVSLTAYLNVGIIGLNKRSK